MSVWNSSNVDFSDAVDVTFASVWNASAGGNASSSLSDDDVFWFNDRCKSFEFSFNTILIGSICLFGIATNLLSIVVLSKDHNNRVATFLLCSLAVADITVLTVVFVILSIFFGTAPIPGVLEHYTGFVIPYLKKYVNPFGYVTQCSTIWITVLVAINRYIAVVHPFKAHRFLTLKVARLQVATVFVLSILVNMPRWFQVEIVDRYIAAYNATMRVVRTTDMGNTMLYEVLYLNVFYTGAVLILPLIVLVVLNAIILTELQMSKRRMKGNLQGSSVPYIGSQEKNITIVIIVVVMVVVVFHTPDRILAVFKAINKADNLRCPHPLVYASHACNLLIVLNSSTNFIIYCAFRRRFRRILLTQVCRPCGGNGNHFEASVRSSHNGSFRHAPRHRQASCTTSESKALNQNHVVVVV